MAAAAGDVELNPGPFNKQPEPKRYSKRLRVRKPLAAQQQGLPPLTDSVQVLKVSDAAARAILRELQLFAEGQTPPTSPQPGQHAWNRPAMRELAARVDALLGPVQAGLRGLTQADLPALRPCPKYAANSMGYYPPGSDLQAAVVPASDADGNCFFNSLLLATLGSQQKGRHALRLRCLLELVQHSETDYRLYHPAKRGDAQHDYSEYCFRRMAQTGGYQGLEAAPVAATVLQCPVLVYCPGYQGANTAPNTTVHFDSAYVPPLYVKDGYVPSTPAVLTWAQTEGGRQARVHSFRANHFQPMVLATEQQARALTEAEHPLCPPAYFEPRDPARRWRDRRGTWAPELTPAEKRSIHHILLRIADALGLPAEQRPPEPQHKRTWDEMIERSGPAEPQKLLRLTGRSTRKSARREGTAVHPATRPRKRKHQDRVTIRQIRQPASEPPRKTATHTQTSRKQLSIMQALAAAAHREQDGQPPASQQKGAHLNAAAASPMRRAVAAARCRRQQQSDKAAAGPLAEQDSRQDGSALGATPAAPNTPSGHLVVTTYNPMGGTTAESVITALAERDPDVLVLPEVKICSRRQRKNMYRRLLGAGYVLAYSLLPGGSLLSIHGREGRHKAGVIVAVAKRHTAHNSLHRPDMGPTAARAADLSGFVSHVQLTPPGGRPLDVLGIYRPCDNKEVRRQVDQYIKETARSCQRHGRALVVAGDLNATIRDADRSTCTAGDADREWRQLVEAIQLAPAGGLPADATEPREPTYRQQVTGAEPVASTIDDVLLCLPTLPAKGEGAQEWSAAECTVLTAGGNSDHEPLEAKLPCEALGYVAPPPQVKAPFKSRRRFCPFNKEEMQRYKEANTTSPAA